MNWKKLLESSAESVNDDLRLRNDYLVAENRIFRNQIDGRVQLTDSERKELAEIGAKLGKQALEEIATVAKADTILAWNRKFADQQVDTCQSPKSVGRPRVDKEIEDWVLRMARENRSWGYDRIQGSLNHLGYTISDQTVGNILKRHGIRPAPERKKTVTWREFIRCHLDVLLATDFFNSDIWNWFGCLMSCLLGFIDGASRQLRVVATMLSQHGPQMQSLMLRVLDVRAHLPRWGRWINGIKKVARLQLIPFCESVQGNALELTPVEEQNARSPALGRVVFISAARPRQKRDGPAPLPHGLNVLIRHDTRQAA